MLRALQTMSILYKLFYCSRSRYDLRRSVSVDAHYRDLNGVGKHLLRVF